jgi:hypothetical protein
MRHLSSSSFRLAIKCLVATRRERNAVLDQDLSSRHPLDVNELAAYGNAPLLVRLAERLAAALWAIDEAVAMCEVEDEVSRDTAWIKPEIRHTYDHVNGVLKMISN